MSQHAASVWFPACWDLLPQQVGTEQGSLLGRYEAAGWDTVSQHADALGPTMLELSVPAWCDAFLAQDV